MKIKLLPDDLSNRIAAGEVVDRPVSVIRELVDNSIDAGATDIAVFVDLGGKKLIRVVDNGEGMERDDAILAFQRHATSKIKTAADLNSITTLGFRGEALPSIAAVSKVELKTHNGEQERGTTVNIQGGKIISVTHDPLPKGTDVSIRHLFFNTPARRKFLTAEKTEIARIKSFLQQCALAYPSIRFRFVSDGEALLNIPIASSIEQRSQSLFQGSFANINRSEGNFTINGRIGHPSTAKVQRVGLTLLVNGRVVQDKILLRAVKDGFDTMLKERELPVGFISLDVPRDFVDVNVHPQKLEVRFSDSQAIFAFVRDSTSQALTLLQTTSRPFEPRENSRAFSGIQNKTTTPQPISYNAISIADAGVLPLFEKSRDAENSTFQKEEIPYSSLRYIGQFALCYLFFESQESLYVLDMHAAHERCQFNRIRKSLKERNVVSQQLLIPEEIPLHEDGRELILSQAELLKSIGFDWDECGMVIKVKSIPGILSKINPRTIFQELQNQEIINRSENIFEEYIDHIAARLACHGSVRSGQKLTVDEVTSLLDDLQESALSSACPHGRPVWSTMKESDVERWFGR